MRFVALRIPGAFVVEPEPVSDERGLFARTYCQSEFAAHGIVARLTQCSLSFNPVKGTLRGMHCQKAPHEEAKLVRCTRGAVHDVIVDLRRDSPTRLAWEGVDLSAGNRRSIFIPPGVAHGFLTLADESEVFYQISGEFEPGSAAGVRWNDPAFGIEWPRAVTLISDRDRDYPDFAP